MEKVYCVNCKYYKQHILNGFICDEYCENNPEIEDTPTCIERTFSYCESKNYNNNCKEFKPTFIYKLTHIFKKEL